MKFNRYRSIENSYRQKFIEKIIFEGHRDKQYYVTEKIHGANFAFYISASGDTGSIRGAKRSAFLGQEDSFFNWQHVREGLEEQLMDLYRLLAETDEDYISVHGELFGGSYPHDGVAHSEGHSKVQNGVFYNPDNQFIAFDITKNGEYLPWSQASLLLKLSNVPYLSTLFQGTLMECLEYPNEFQTTIPSYASLPEIENNICEGVVIKPYHDNINLLDGSRVILKNKNSKWSEGGGAKKKVPKELSEPLREVVSLITTYITEQRLNNVISKIGEVTMKDFGPVMKEMNQDVMQDFLKDYQDKIDALDKSDRKLVGKQLNSYSSPLIKKYFMENV